MRIAGNYILDIIIYTHSLLHSLYRGVTHKLTLRCNLKHPGGNITCSFPCNALQGFCGVQYSAGCRLTGLYHTHQPSCVFSLEGVEDHCEWIEFASVDPQHEAPGDSHVFGPLASHRRQPPVACNELLRKVADRCTQRLQHTQRDHAFKS